MIVNYSYKFEKKYTKLVVIPTTAGSGAEVTSNAVIYVNDIKYSFESKLLLPDEYFLIPELITSGTYKIKASSGFDVIAQALESLISKKSNLLSVEYASKSLGISTNNFVPFVNKTNLENATQMCLAANSNLGKAINISKTTVPHATSYPFTSHFNISHGHAVCLFFEKFFMYNYINSDNSDTSFNLKERFNTIFNLLGVLNINEFNSKIINIKKEVKLEDDLEKLGIDISKNSDKIMTGINHLRLGNNPVKMDLNDIYKIISS